jgi:hypothetical protein
MRLEHAFLTKVGEELSSRHVFHEHVKMLRGLPNAIKIYLSLIDLYDERMIDYAEDAVFIVDVIYLLRFNKFFLPHDLCA